MTGRRVKTIYDRSKFIKQYIYMSSISDMYFRETGMRRSSWHGAQLINPKIDVRRNNYITRIINGRLYFISSMRRQIQFRDRELRQIRNKSHKYY